MIRPALLAALLLSLSGAAPPLPKPGEVKTFRDWAAGCDNVRRCAVASLAPAGGAMMPIVMQVSRDAGPAGAWRIVLTPIGDAPRPAGIWIDGKRIGAALQPLGDGAVASGAAAEPIVALLANSRTLTLGDEGGKRLATISPLGLAAALRYMDATQGRAGTVSAIVAKGDKPASAVPPGAALPVIAAVRPSGRAALPTAAQATALRRSAKCDEDIVADAKPQAFALDSGKALVLIPCSSGAYNLSSAVFVIDRGKPRPASFDAPSGFGGRTAVPMVVNAGYAAGTLTSYAKGRGPGDCGTMQSFVWDGTRFRLSEQSEMGECRGNPEFITTWRASVIRR